MQIQQYCKKHLYADIEQRDTKKNQTKSANQITQSRVKLVSICQKEYHKLLELYV